MKKRCKKWGSILKQTTMKKKATKPAANNKVKKPVSEKDMSVTKRLLDLKIQEVKGDVTSLRLEMKAGFTQIESRFKEQDAKFLSQDAKLEVLDTKITKMMILLEDQNDRNRAALDGYATVYEKFSDTDERLSKLEEKTFGSKQR